MRLLLTAFEPYDDWTENSSWLALVELLKDRPSQYELTTRRYPVSLSKLREQLDRDLQSSEFDAVLHLGQAPGATEIKLEAVALNVAGKLIDEGDELPALIESAPLAFRSSLPLSSFNRILTDAGIPSRVSYHAGTFLCNATMYLSHYWFHSRGENRPIGFLHLPLASEQAAKKSYKLASLPTQTLAQALDLVIGELGATASSSRDQVA